MRRLTELRFEWEISQSTEFRYETKNIGNQRLQSSLGSSINFMRPLLSYYIKITVNDFD